MWSGGAPSGSLFSQLGLIDVSQLNFVSLTLLVGRCANGQRTKDWRTMRLHGGYLNYRPGENSVYQGAFISPDSFEHVKLLTIRSMMAATGAIGSIATFGPTGKRLLM